MMQRTRLQLPGGFAHGVSRKRNTFMQKEQKLVFDQSQEGHSRIGGLAKSSFFIYHDFIK